MTDRSELGGIDENYIPNPLIIDDLLAFADVDGNGEVGAADYLLAYATLYEKEISECLTNGISLKTSMQAADINGDGTVTEADKEIGIDFALSGSSTYPIGETVENTYPCVVAGNRILVSAQYAYNPSGLRSAKTVGGSTKYFVYNGMNIVYEYEDSISDGVVYCYGLNRTHNSDGEIYVYNAHGDTVQLVKDNEVVASYTYDAFGNLTSELCDNDNAFLYCSEYFDAETKTYYLRARYYNPANGRFTQEDPIGAGLNWYTYCSSNPVMYVDPWGLEKIVVSGGSDGAEKFKYNFIESAIMQISDWKKIAPEEEIAWIIANWNYTEADIANFNTVAETYGVKIMIIDNKKTLFEYIGREGREDDLITSMSFFAHGTAFEFGPVSNGDYTDQYAVALGYSATLGVPHNNALNIFAADLENISSEAFAQNSFTFFGSCRTGTELGGAVFAQQWANTTGGIVKASTGRTEYYNIFPDERSFTTKIRNIWYKYFSPEKYVKAEREIAREKYGFSAVGCKNYPVPVSGYQWAFFRPL